MGRVYISGTITERFWARVDKNGPVPPHRPDLGPCWVWTGGRSEGYGAMSNVNGKNLRAHVVGFFVQFGRWADPWALHKCDNRLCVRGDHLFEGSRADNIADMRAKGRGSPPPRRHGEQHPSSWLTEANVREIRADADAMAGKYGAQARLARKLHVPVRAVWAVANGKTWKTLR